ncbi:sodium:solute symporter family transporter [Mesomycoplasma hyorhinis]|uniref:sodium:solute symporter family transporter n=1 Tax=Mesomycoplasma hyorhinis TaxID=2100 RepID=UPI001C05204D|nr:sialic acid transporter [Mesomycoplasma hyorhinis]
MNFSWLDWVVIVFYLLAMLAMGAFFFLQAKGQKAKGQFNNSKYLTAKGMKIPALVIGLSIWAAGLNSITFLSTPGLAFKTGWMSAIAQLSFFLVVPILIKFVVPFYCRMRESTAYAYLEKRFHYSLRAIASISFILFHIFRIAIVLYIPTLALSLFVNINVIYYYLLLLL